MKLIDADECLSVETMKVFPVFGEAGANVEDLKELIASCKPVDAVPVVRCKDCKYASEIMPFTCLCLLSKIRMALDGFCSMGENGVTE